MALLGLTLVTLPAQAEQRCDTKQVETLSVKVGTAPANLRPGQPIDVPVSVVRGADTPAFDVQVLVGLSGLRWGAYAQLMSGMDGRAVVHLVVPTDAVGKAVLDVEVVRGLVNAPCVVIEEHGRVSRPWGRATR